MGTFCSPEECKAGTTLRSVDKIDDDILDDLYIIPAQDSIILHYRLDVNSAGEPYSWQGVFAVRPDYRQRYFDDFRRAVILKVEQWAENPGDRQGETAGGASVTFSRRMPSRIDSLMRKWGKAGGKTGRIYRA